MKIFIIIITSVRHVTSSPSSLPTFLTVNFGIRLPAGAESGESSLQQGLCHRPPPPLDPPTGDRGLSTPVTASRPSCLSGV